jgi:hypothetical protein
MNIGVSMANDDEAIVDLIDPNPLTDTGKWRAEIHQRLAEAMQAFEVVKAALLKQEAERMAHDAAMEKLGETMELTKTELHQWQETLKAEQQKRDVADKSKIDSWKFLRNIASYIVGEVDKRQK